MCYKYFVLFTYLFKIISSLVDLKNLEELNCRDNENYSVDWWFIYKPPSEELPMYKLGHDFVYITSYVAGRWKHSGRHISPNSMLQRTLDPLYTGTSDSLAVLTYEEKKGKRVKSGSSSFGLLMANELGGVWMGHTVPGLVDFTKFHPSFPAKEIAQGHLLMCLSLDTFTLNQMGRLIQAVSPTFSRIRIPTRMRTYLPDWTSIRYNGLKILRPLQKMMDIIPRKSSLLAKMLIRTPGDQFCPYAHFAKKMNLVLDIYGHQKHNMPYCFANYSTRNIEKISMKSVQYVHYIPRKRDRISFAVSTTSHWQRIGGSGKDQYWTCIGPAEDVSGNGAILMCVNRFEVWQSFDNFKVKEPEC